MATEAEHRDALIAQASDIGRKAAFWSETYRRDSATWRRLNTALVIIAGLAAAAAAGVTSLATLTSAARIVAAVAALAAAGTSAVVAALAGAKRSGDALAAAVRETTLADHAIAFVQTTAPFADITAVTTAYEQLLRERDQVVAASPGTQLPRLMRQRQR